MSELSNARAYFSYRWAIPGFAFILLIVGINYVPLLNFLERTGNSQTFGVLLAFLTLLSGSALGFLVSQIYWQNFSKNGGILGVKEFKDADQILVRQLGYSLVSDEKERRKIGGAILDFILYLQEREFLNYAWRRWDMYHLQRSTSCVLLIGLTAGFAFRFSFALRQFFLSNICLISIESWIHSFVFSELPLLLPLSIFAILLALVLRNAAHNLITDYRPIFDALVRDVLNNPNKRPRIIGAFSGLLH